MFDGKPTLMLAALIGGLALFVAGFIIALEVRSTVASPAAGATNGGACYTNWKGNTCASGYTAVETGVWNAVYWGEKGVTPEFQGAGSLVCAADVPNGLGVTNFRRAVNNSDTDGTEYVDRQPCAICCASGVGGAVGGIGELPEVAGTGDTLPRNHIIVATVTALVAFGVGTWYARKRWAR